MIHSFLILVSKWSEGSDVLLESRLLLVGGVSLSAGSGFLSTPCESWLNSLDDFPFGVQFHTAVAVIRTRSPDRD